MRFEDVARAASSALPAGGCADDARAAADPGRSPTGRRVRCRGARVADWPRGDEARRGRPRCWCWSIPMTAGEARVLLTERVAGAGITRARSRSRRPRRARDADAAATALREANEEVGLDAGGGGRPGRGHLAVALDPASATSR